MGSNGGDEVMVSGSHEPGCSEATVEIKIKTLDSGTYTLRVDKCVPVPALKEQIASVTGVVSEQQRLICRGKVLNDDQLLSAYHVEDGHTLHMVVRQPIPPSEGLPDHPASDPALSAGHSQGSRGPSVVVGTFNISEQGDGNLPDLSRVVSAVLSSFGITGIGSGIEGVDLMEPPLEMLSRMSVANGASDSSRQQTDQATTVNRSNALNIGSSGHQTTSPLEPLQPLVIPDSLTTLSQYLNHLRNEFVANGGNGNNLQAVGTHGSNVQDERAPPAIGGQSGLPGPSSLAEMMLSTRQLLIEQAAECLSHLARQLEDHGNVTDTSTRTGFQLNMLRSGVLLQNLGASLLELGRTTMMLRLGQTPADAVVSAGPAVFISTSGPHPIMVQPHPFQLGTSFGAIPIGTAQPSSPSGGIHGSVPRNIDIRIRSGSLIPSVVVNLREQSGSGQSPGQTNPAVSGVSNSIHPAAAGASGVPSSIRESEVRVLPIRTVVAAIPTIRGTRSDSSQSLVRLVLPVLARVQHVSYGNLSSVRGSQSSSEHNSSGLDAEQQRILESDGHQQNTGLPGREGNNLSGGGTQSTGGISQLRSRFDQLLRSMFPGEQFHGGVNSQSTTNSAAVHAETAEATSNTVEAAPGVTDEGIFLSNVLHQIMPYISQSTDMGSDAATSERDTSNRQASSRQDMDSDVGTSSRRADPSTPPSAKRQKRE